MEAPKPTAAQVADYYGRFFRYKTTKPCKDKAAENQCAVRLSMALEGLSPGFLDDFVPPDRVHRDRKTCIDLPPHVLGAAELGRYLTDQWGLPYEVLQNRPGIIWFEECYVRNGFRSDHVDFWTGWHYMNELFKVSAGGNAGIGDDLFAKSKGAVRFFPLLVS
jgi:hypothetical protein